MTMHEDAPVLDAKENELLLSEIASIELLSILQQSNAPIGTYNKILDWAKRQNPKSFSSMKGREAVINDLTRRYNLDNLQSELKDCYLPGSRT